MVIEKKTASFIRKALQSEGFVVDMLHNGDEALTAITNTPFDAVVLDIMLPGRDGLSRRSPVARTQQQDAGAVAYRARSTQ